jgi:hypothetical protein
VHLKNTKCPVDGSTDFSGVASNLQHSYQESLCKRAGRSAPWLEKRYVTASYVRAFPSLLFGCTRRRVFSKESVLENGTQRIAIEFNCHDVSCASLRFWLFMQQQAEWQITFSVNDGPGADRKGGEGLSTASHSRPTTSPAVASGEAAPR